MSLGTLATLRPYSVVRGGPLLVVFQVQGVHVEGVDDVTGVLEPAMYRKKQERMRGLQSP